MPQKDAYQGDIYRIKLSLSGALQESIEHLPKYTLEYVCYSEGRLHKYHQ